MDRHEFLEKRRRFIGASDIGTILGENPYATIHDVYMEKCGLTEIDDELTEQQESGLEKEQYLIERYVKKTGLEAVHAGGLFYVQPDYPWASCHPDGFASTEPIVLRTSPDDGTPFDLTREDLQAQNLIGLECKNRSHFSKGWGEEGSDEIPTEVLLQCQWSMFVTGLKRWDVTVEIGGNRHRIYRVQRDDKLIDRLVQIAAQFYQKQMVEQEEPDVDGSAGARRMLNLKEIEPEKVMQSDADMDARIATYTQLLAQEKEVAQKAELVRQKIEFAMGNANIVSGPGYELKRTQNTSRRTNWRLVAQELEPSPQLVQKHTKRILGKPRLTIKNLIQEESYGD